VELAGFDSVVELIEDLQAFLNRNGVEVEYDQFSEGRFGLYPVGDDWMIDVLDGRFIQVWLEAHKERAAQVIRLFNEYFGLSS